MTPSLGVVCNLFEEANALPGWLEMACSGLFDEVLCYHTGPGGVYSRDGTIEIIEKWGARLEFGAIDDGFGIVRTRAVRLSSCEWVMILDADERFWRYAPLLQCDDDLNVTIEKPDPYDQGAILREWLRIPNVDAVCTQRRHWHDLTWRRPTQNWCAIPDWQLRTVRNKEYIQYTPITKMHEHIVDLRTMTEPRFIRSDSLRGPFHDHYHCWYKPMEPEQRQEDIHVYDALADNRTVPIPGERIIGMQMPAQGEAVTP